jgi:hypothetical protein
VGVTVIIAAAAAVSYFASQINAVTESVKKYNEAVAENTHKKHHKGWRRSGILPQRR